MQKNSITNKITPCCGLPFSVIYWWVSNLTLNSESDRQFILSKISQGGVLSIDAWKVLINSGTLEADASLTKAEFLAWFNCNKQPTCEQLKIIIEGFKVGNWTPETELPSNLALIDAVVNGVNYTGNVYTKEQVNQILTTSFGGDLVVSDNPQPTSAKWYFAKESGTYTNAGGLVVDLTNKLVVLNYDGTWSKVEVAMPQPKIPTWTAQTYASGSQVIHNGKIYEANGAASSTDIPGTSSLWVLKFEGGGIKQYDETTAYKANETVVKGNDLYKVKPDYIEGMPAGTDPETSPAFRKLSSEIRHKANTIVELQENINFPADTLAIVTEEENPNNNGIYKKISPEGSGGWEKTNFVNPLFSKNGNMSIGGGLTSVYTEAETPGSGTANVTFGVNVGHNIGAGWANILFGYNVGSSLADKSVVNSWTKELGNVGNIFFGYNIASAANGALDCSIFGNGAGQNMFNAMDNCFFGVWAGKLIEYGSENAFYGHLAGGYYVGKGDEANIDKTTQDPNSTEYSWGHRITAIGNLAGALDLGGNALQYGKKNVYIGSHTRGNNWAINENVFGYKAQGRGSNTVSIGNYEVKETHYYGILTNWTDRRFADLPTPNRALLGARSFILDANTRVFDAVVSGGGSNIVPVWCDGSSWRVG